MELPTGTILDGAYRIVSAIRLGKDGDVYLGEPVSPGPKVMIHILRTAVMEGDTALPIFERAGRALCRFSHDAFPEVVDFGRFMVRPYLVTELAQERTLAQILSTGELSSARALQIINQVREAIQAAHRKGMAHGALTADSVLVSKEGEVKIVDLFRRWVTHQIATRGARMDPSADVQALVALSHLMMKSARRVAMAKPSNWNDFTPEPQCEGWGTPPTIVSARPSLTPEAPPKVRPAVHKPVQVRLPPPMDRASQPAKLRITSHAGGGAMALSPVTTEIDLSQLQNSAARSSLYLVLVCASMLLTLAIVLRF